jgi:hypothetical protein
MQVQVAWEGPNDTETPYVLGDAYQKSVFSATTPAATLRLLFVPLQVQT